MPYNVLVLSPELSTLARYVAEFFNADVVPSEADVQASISDKNYRVLVLDEAESSNSLNRCAVLLSSEWMQGIPLVVLSSRHTVQDKISALNVGCDDFIDSQSEPAEVCARITKSIFHQIASSQLRQFLRCPIGVAPSAGVRHGSQSANAEFLSQLNACDNLDQLGQQFFAKIECFGLSCSLQIRSGAETKNMEAHGMAKDLESQLLLQFKDKGRYIDLGKRSIVNYDRVSLLIKNMPTNDAEECDAIKDGTLRLVQGVNARVLALEGRLGC